MPIIRVTKKHIQAAKKAREVALKKNEDFRLHEERLHRFQENVVRREATSHKEPKDVAAIREEQL